MEKTVSLWHLSKSAFLVYKAQADVSFSSLFVYRVLCLRYRGQGGGGVRTERTNIFRKRFFVPKAPPRPDVRSLCLCLSSRHRQKVLLVCFKWKGLLCSACVARQQTSTEPAYYRCTFQKEITTNGKRGDFPSGAHLFSFSSVFFSIFIICCFLRLCRPMHPP